MNLHISQLINPSNMTLETDGDKGRIEIDVKLSKTGKFYIATKAMEYWVKDIETETIEGEDKVILEDAMIHLTRSVPTDSNNVDGQFSVYHEIHGLKPLIWFVGEKPNRQGRSIQVISK